LDKTKLEMKTSELRIGNKVMMNSKVITMDVRMFHAVIHGFEGYEPEPIPLTPEWLKRFGFDQESSGSSKEGRWQSYGIEETTDKFGLQYILDTEKFEFYYDVGSFQQELEIMYVHQLQNLYFTLTLQELTLNN
jgi:hypothetical protein